MRSLGGSVSKTWNSINPATLSGAIDVIVVEQEDSIIHMSGPALMRTLTVPQGLWHVLPFMSDLGNSHCFGRMKRRFAAPIYRSPYEAYRLSLGRVQGQREQTELCYEAW